MAQYENPYIRVHLTDFEGLPLVDVWGEVDLGTLPHLQRVLDEALGTGPKALIIDLRKVTFIDSSGVGALIGAKKRLLPFRGELYVVCGDDHVRRKLGIMKLASIMRLHPSTEEALADAREELRASRPGQQPP